MVIPKHKVYNVVSLDDISLIEEMISHFGRFWSQPDAVQQTARRIQHAVDLRTSEVIKGLEDMQDQTMAATVSAEYEVMMQDIIRKSTNDMLCRLETLNTNDFIFGFHATPHASVGHLHMHVLAAGTDFRRYSTDAHDWKTIPATAVMQVIHEEKVAQGNMLADENNK
ncbi:hypothetical protein DXG01_015243 [Tephrocybe rancida]|nr:hypothetical protein DXG01_015243 [Tephrocybe rancida]